MHRLSTEQLHEKIIRLTFDKNRLEQHKKLNQLLLNGLNAVQSLNSKQAIFQAFFALLGDVIDFDQAMILQLDHLTEPLVTSACMQVSLCEEQRQQLLKFCPPQQSNFCNLLLEPQWQGLLQQLWPTLNSMLVQPFNTSRSRYCLMLGQAAIGGFAADDLQLISQFMVFAVNTLDKIETQQLLLEGEALKQQHQQMQQSLIQSEKMASLGQLAAGVAHELNNPLGYILSNISTFKSYIETYHQVIGLYQQLDTLVSDYPQCQPLLQQIRQTTAKNDLNYILTDSVDLIDDSIEGAIRLRDIINSLRRFSHPDRGVLEQVQVNEVLQSTVRMIWSEIKNNTKLEFDLADDLPPILANPSQLSQIFLNLLLNASQAMTQKMGQIRLISRRQGQFVRLEISDNGSGIAPENLTRIFEPFFTTKDVGKGTGLGLSLVKAMMDSHHGEIQLESALGVGSRFILLFPCQSVVAGADAGDDAMQR